MSLLRASAAILAGGRARRFGGLDKSRLVVQGRPIIVRQVELLQTVADDVFVVAPDAARFADLGLRVVPDLIPGAGAMGGVFTALDAASADWAIVVACDLPFLDADLFRRLLAMAPGHDGAWVRTARGAEPLAAIYARDTRVAIRTEIDAGRRRLQDLGGVLRMAEIDAAALAEFGSAERLLTNINSPADYARVQ